MGRSRLYSKEFNSWTRIRIQLLQDIIDMFDEYKVKYWLDGGSLLGLMRDGEIIYNDSDHDFCIKVEDLDDNFIRMMDDIAKDPKFDQRYNRIKQNHYKRCLSTGVFTCSNYYQIAYAQPYQDGNHLRRVYADLFVVFPFKDFYWYKLYDYRFRFKAEHLQEFDTVKAYGRDIRIPKNYSDYLDIEYNNRWRVREKFKAYTTTFWHNWTEYTTELPKDYKYIKMNSKTLIP